MSYDSSKQSPTAQGSYGLLSGNGPAQPPRRSTHSKIAHFAARMPETSVNSVCGALAGAASGIVTCPLDVIKTKLQAQGGFRPRATDGAARSPAQYRGLISTASTIWRQDGLRGMYRGLGPMLVGYLPTWAVYMSVYGSSREYYYSRLDNKWLAQVYASVTAGACSTIVTNPIWVVKTRLMSQVGATAAKDARTPWHYKSTIDAFRTMYRTEGIGSFYSGLAPALLGLTHVAIQFPLYEFFKLKFTGLEMGQNDPANQSGSHWFSILGATFLSKICATTATYPHEVLRTRLQVQLRQRKIARNTAIAAASASGTTGGSPKVEVPEAKTEGPRYKGVVMTCRTILQEEGWRAFYYGMGTNLIRAVPSAMTTMLTFEALKRTVHQMQEEARQEDIS